MVNESLKDREIAKLRADSARLRARFSSLFALVARISSCVGERAVLQEIARCGCEAAEALYGVVILFKGDGSVKEFVPHGVPEHAAERIAALPQGLGLLGWIREQQRPIRLANVTEHPRSLGVPEHHPPLTALLSAPLAWDGRYLGALIVAEKKGFPEFSEEDEEMLGLFASHAAAAVSLAGNGTGRLHIASDRASSGGQAEEVLVPRQDETPAPRVISAADLPDLDGGPTTGSPVADDVTQGNGVERLPDGLLSMVSHELRSPLAIIKAVVESARTEEAAAHDDSVPDAMEAIERQADRLLATVDNLLDMAQMEAGGFKVATRLTDLQPLFDDIANTFRRRGTTSLVFEVPMRLPPISMDLRRVRQVLDNLIGNAITHARPNTPIRIGVHANESQLTVSVYHLGPGIPPSEIPYLLKNSSQAGAVSRLSGTGLSLAISQGIIEAHGGHIWVTSSVARGETTFNFTLPIASEQPDETETQPAVAPRAIRAGKVRRAGERTRVLAVDDEPQMLRYLQRTLTNAGYQPLVTEDPAKAVEMVEAEDPDLVLLDLVFPGADGLKVLKDIRDVSGVPVLFLSAIDGEVIVQALQSGADDYITKPFSASELLARVEASLRRRVSPEQVEIRPPYRIEDLTVDFNNRRVTLRNELVPLSATEHKLLFELAGNAGRVLTNQELLRRIWGPEYSGESHLLRSFVRNLRRKLGDDARSPRIIYTERGIGYSMRKD
ncbi:MAG: response regulator [Dehalococcoidia bacterium]